MSKNPLEKAIESAVGEHAKGLGYLVYKFTSPARRSVPDRIYIPPNAAPAFFIEFKRLGCSPTQAQEIEISKIRAQGTRVFIVDDKVQGKILVADYINGFECKDIPDKPSAPVRELGIKKRKSKDKCRFCGAKEKDGICQNHGCGDNTQLQRRSKHSAKVDVNNPRDPFF